LVLSAPGLFPGRGYAITVNEEETLSREFMKVVSSRFEFIQDPLITTYVSGIGKHIVSVLPPQPFSYHFYVIRENVYNAFATPAGHIFINSGLIMAMENEEELAGILAHEIAHVACRHISQKIDRSKKLQIATLAGVVAGIFLGVGGSAVAGNAVTAGSIAAGQSAALAYSREDEMQADQLGLDLLSKAGYGANGLLSVLEKIRAKQWFGSDQIPSYLSTHPASEERMANIDVWIEKHDEAVDKKKADPAFARMHARLLALYEEERIALEFFEAAVKKNPDDATALYGYGLVLGRIGRRDDAIRQFRAALAYQAFDPYILTGLGQMYFLEGRYADALRVLDGASSISENDPELLFYLGRSQMEVGDLEAAAQTLGQVIEITGTYHKAYYFLGDIYGKMEKLGDAHYYLGMYYKNTKDIKNALFHLRKAATYSTADPERAQHIRQMLEELQKQEAELKVDQMIKDRKR